MRKVTVVGYMMVLVLSSVIVGTIFAQDDTETAWLGVRLAETDEGVVVHRVEAGSPAEDAGLQSGDVMVSVDSEAVESADAVAEVVQAHAPGDVIAVVVTRDGSEETFDIELGTTPTNGRGTHDLFADGDLDPLVAAEHVLHVELDAVDNGYRVLAGRMSDQSELQVGDVITAVNDTPIQGVDWSVLVTELAASDNSTLTITVQRDGEEVTVESSLFAGGHGGRGDFGGRGGGRQPGDNSQQGDGQQDDDSQPSERSPALNTSSSPA